MELDFIFSHDSANLAVIVATLHLATQLSNCEEYENVVKYLEELVKNQSDIPSAK